MKVLINGKPMTPEDTLQLSRDDGSVLALTPDVLATRLSKADQAEQSATELARLRRTLEAREAELTLAKDKARETNPLSTDQQTDDTTKTPAKDERAATDRLIRELVLRAVFEGSAFLREKTVLTPDIAMHAFGRFFKVRYVDGQPVAVGYLEQEGQVRPLMSRTSPRRFAEPEEALERIIDAYPHKDQVLKAGRSGMGAIGNQASQDRPASGFSTADRRIVDQEWVTAIFNNA